MYYRIVHGAITCCVAAAPTLTPNHSRVATLPHVCQDKLAKWAVSWLKGAGSWASGCCGVGLPCGSGPDLAMTTMPIHPNTLNIARPTATFHSYRVHWVHPPSSQSCGLKNMVTPKVVADLSTSRNEHISRNF